MKDFLIIEERKEIITNLANHLRESLATQFIGNVPDKDTSSQICKYVETFLKSNNIDLIPVVYINGPVLTVNFIGRK